MRQNLEKRLAALLEESQENRKKYIEKKYAVRYHKVRFFERIKVERTIKKLKKALKTSSDQSLKDGLAEAEEDLEYILHFPKGEKYVSLLKDADDPEAQEHLKSERNRLRLLVKQQLRDEAIVNELNEGMPSIERPVAKIGKDIKAGPMEHNDTSQSEENIEDDDFFAQSSEESDSDISVPSAGKEQSEISLDMSLGDNGTSSSMDKNQTDSDDTGNVQITSPTKNFETHHRRETEEKHAKVRQPREDSKKKAHPGINKEKMRKKGYGISSKGKRQSSGQRKDTKQPLRSRAEGGRKRRRKKS